MDLNQNSCDTSAQLLNMILIESCMAENEMDRLGIKDARLRKIINDASVMMKGNEPEIAGYCNTLNFIYRNYMYVPIHAKYIAQLHDNLYRFTYLNSNGLYRDEASSGSCEETIEYRLSLMCSGYADSLKYRCDPLFVIPIFLVDLYALQPFVYGNKRILRLMMLCLLLTNHISVVQIVSLDEYINESYIEFETALSTCLTKNGGIKTYTPFVHYFFKLLVSIVKACDFRLQHANYLQMDQTQCVEFVIKNSKESVSKSQLDKLCPTISSLMISKVLSQLLAQQRIVKIGNGRYTMYRWNYENDAWNNMDIDAMHKVIVIGCTGSGKTTFSTKLAQYIKLPLYHLDMMNWNPDQTTVEKELFNDRISNAMASENWIIDGNYSSSLERRFKAADTVFFLDYDTDVCLQGVKQGLGKIRSDMPWINPCNEIDADFMNFILHYRETDRLRVMDLIAKYHGKQIIIFKNRNESQEYLDQLQLYIGNKKHG